MAMYCLYCINSSGGYGLDFEQHKGYGGAIIYGGLIDGQRNFRQAVPADYALVDRPPWSGACLTEKQVRRLHQARPVYCRRRVSL